MSEHRSPFPDRLVTVTEVAERTHVSRPTVIKWIETGRLTGFRLGDSQWRIDPRSVELMLRETHRGRPIEELDQLEQNGPDPDGPDDQHDETG